MGEYDSLKRPLPWYLLGPTVTTRTTEDDETECGSSSFVWPEDSDERVVIPFLLSLNEYNVLASALDVGADIAFSDDYLRVMWLWSRNMRCPVDLCELIAECIATSSGTQNSILNMLFESTSFNTFVEEKSTQNVYEAWPTLDDPNEICNAATYVVGKMRELIVGVYADLETLTPQEAFESLLGLFGWRSGPLYQLIGLLETEDETALLEAWDDAAPDLICQLMASEFDQTPILIWVDAEYPSGVLHDAFTYAIESAADNGKYAQWIAVGALQTGADCDYCGITETRTPVVASEWDTPNTAGVLTGPDGGGYYTVTAEDRTTDFAFVIMDVLGRRFVVTDISYTFRPQCQVLYDDPTLVYIGCPGADIYAGETVTEYWSTWSTAQGVQSMQFKLSAP